MKFTHVGNVYKPMSNNQEVFSFKNYKQAKFHLEKQEAILTLINTAIKGFTLFAAYKAASNCLEVLKSEKIMVETTISKCKAILKSKGKL